MMQWHWRKILGGLFLYAVIFLSLSLIGSHLIWHVLVLIFLLFLGDVLMAFWPLSSDPSVNFDPLPPNIPDHAPQHFFYRLILQRYRPGLSVRVVQHWQTPKGLAVVAGSWLWPWAPHVTAQSLAIPGAGRGHYILTHSQIIARDIFALGCKTWTVPTRQTVWVWPQIIPLCPQKIAPWILGSHAVPHTFAASLQETGLRAYHAGDSLTHVHWKASARTGALKIREFSLQNDEPAAMLRIYSGPLFSSAEQQELALSIAASILMALSATRISLTLAIGPYRWHSSHMPDLLNHLASIPSLTDLPESFLSPAQRPNILEIRPTPPEAAAHNPSAIFVIRSGQPPQRVDRLEDLLNLA
ncbi:MAG: DUF58 domain-containing protein [Firmicutes bacterium]|nr:DUF58 domain-containing protein [Bacillota bacterium]